MALLYRTMKRIDHERLTRIARTLSEDDARWLRACVIDEPAKPSNRTSERNNLIREAVAQFFPGMSALEQATRFHIELARFHNTAWRYERDVEQCPARHHGTIRAACWTILRMRDYLIGVRQLRKIIGTK